MFGADTNTIVLSGTLDSEPQIKAIKGDSKTVSFSLAVNKMITTDEGQTRQITSWFNIASYNNSVVDACTKLKKGDQVILSGTLNVRSWKDDSDKKRTKYEIVTDKLKSIQDSQNTVNIGLMSGTLDEEPKVRETANNKEVISCSITSSRLLLDKENGGGFKSISSWFKVSSYEPNIVNKLKECAAGDNVFFTGSLNVRSWTDAQGEKQLRYELYPTDVISLSSGNQAKLDNVFDSSDSDTELDDDIFG